MEMRTPPTTSTVGWRVRRLGIQPFEVGDRGLGLRIVLHEKPVELFVNERRNLGPVVIEVLRIHGENRMTVWNHARLDLDRPSEQPARQIPSVEQTLQLLPSHLLQNRSRCQTDFDRASRCVLTADSDNESGQGQPDRQRKTSRSAHRVPLVLPSDMKRPVKLARCSVLFLSVLFLPRESSIGGGRDGYRDG